MRSLLVLLAAAAACASKSANDLPDASFAGPHCTPGNPFDLTGSAGVLATLNVHIDAGGIVNAEATASMLLILDVVQTGGDLAVTARPCDLTIPDIPVSGQNQPIHFALGPGLIASVMPVSGAGKVDGQTTCSNLVSDPMTIAIGARLKPLATAPLPEADDTGAFTSCLPSTAGCYNAITSNCACDQEADGNPGATLLASNVPGIALDEAFVDLRTTFSLDGQVFSSDDIEGDVTSSLEQGILGCHKSTGQDCNPDEIKLVKNLNPTITPSQEQPSTFHAVRVDPSTTCDQLKAEETTLFPSSRASSSRAVRRRRSPSRRGGRAPARARCCSATRRGRSPSRSARRAGRSRSPSTT
jgi:hypothetical protein